ncbi:unnamed protein product [Leptidea sinapis]|uniref:CFA20 domain-containing protein n=1 Tax=Leptidea sinapis TaxID=189913 RepID=A0A5E4R6G4_9NEOP|nr:unnamed protein product [Leptidea sinapis]
MFKNTYQSGLLSIFYSCGSNPLAIWDMEVQNGHIKRLTDSEVNSVVLEIVSTNVTTTYISCPKRNLLLGIKLPFLVMIVKNMKRYFSFEITILDDKNMRRRFRISNFQSTTKIKPFCTTMPIGLSGGWNQIQFNLADFTQRAYGTQFVETLRVQVHANVRLRRIYFCEKLYSEEELPQDYKLYLPLDQKLKKGNLSKKDTPPARTVTKVVPRRVKRQASSVKETVAEVSVKADVDDNNEVKLSSAAKTTVTTEGDLAEEPEEIQIDKKADTENAEQEDPSPTPTNEVESKAKEQPAKEADKILNPDAVETTEEVSTPVPKYSAEGE